MARRRVMDFERTPVGRRKTRDFDYTHLAASGGCPGGVQIRCRTRVYEPEAGSADEMPVMVLSNVGYGITLDIEYIAAEVMLLEYPERAIAAKKREQWFALIEHYPRYSDLGTMEETFKVVEFDDWRPRVGRWPVRRKRVEDVLHWNTHPSNRRVRFGSPNWTPISRIETADLIGATSR